MLRACLMRLEKSSDAELAAQRVVEVPRALSGLRSSITQPEEQGCNL